MDTRKCMLSTIDNPYDPFKQFDDWFRYDADMQYYSCSRLARIAKVTEDMTDQEASRETERAIDEIIQYDPFHLYIKVFKKD